MRDIDERSARMHNPESDAPSLSDEPRYAVLVATFLDETEATETLTSLLDAGYDGTLISNESGGRIVFSIRIGPFEDLWEAERAAAMLDAAYGYSTTVTVSRGDRS